MGTRTANGFRAMMARQIEFGIINCGNPFIEVYLDSMDCSVAVEIDQLRELQQQIARWPDTDNSVSAVVLNKWLYGWKEADKCLACLGLRPSAKWTEGLQAAQRAVIPKAGTTV